MSFFCIGKNIANEIVDWRKLRKYSDDDNGNDDDDEEDGDGGNGGGGDEYAKKIWKKKWKRTKEKYNFIKYENNNNNKQRQRQFEFVSIQMEKYEYSAIWNYSHTCTFDGAPSAATIAV